MRVLRLLLVFALVSIGTAPPLVAQQPLPPPDSASGQIRLVLRAFYLNLHSHNWDALAGYVLSPKLLERRGVPDDARMVARDRTRSRGASIAAALPTCPSTASPMVDDAAIRVDGDWADVSVPRCDGRAPGIDQFGMLYFESRWRFIYTDLFEARPAPETAAR